MKTTTATAVTGDKKHNAALTSGGVPFGKPTDAELARFQRVMATLYEKMGSRSLGWVADKLQDVADGQGGEFSMILKLMPDLLHSGEGLPAGLLPSGKTALEELPIYFDHESASRSLASVRVGYNGEWVETNSQLTKLGYAAEFWLEINFARTHLQTISNCGEGSTLRDCRSMIIGAGCKPEGYLSFLACIFAMNKWPASWRRVLRYDEKDDERKNELNRIVFVGSTVTLVDDRTHYYLGFMQSKCGKGCSVGPHGARAVPVLFPSNTVLDGAKEEKFFFVFSKQQ